MADFQIPDKDLLTNVDRGADPFLIYDNDAAALKRTTINNALNVTSQPVSVDDTQTLANKTLTSPIMTSPSMSSPVLSGTITGTYTIAGTPTFPSSVVTLTGLQTLTNKVLTNPTLTIDTISEYTAANGVTIDGLNIKDGVLTTAGSVTNAALAGGITGDKLATLLGSAVKSTAITGATGDLAGLSITVNVATGNTVLLQSFLCGINKYNGSNSMEVYLQEGATVLATGSLITPALNYKNSCNASCIITPTAGSHTYKMASASVNSSFDTVPPSYIMATVID